MDRNLIWIESVQSCFAGDRLTDALLQSTRVAASMKDRQYPNLFFSNGVVNAVELKSVDGCPTHIRKSDSVVQRRVT
jgi:hypothetical protein